MNTSQRGQLVLAIDELLCTDPERAAALANDVPTWVLDQYKAAAQQVYARIPAVAASTDSTVSSSTLSQAPGWVRLNVLDTIVGWSAGHGQVCVHQPHPSRPQPVVAAAWKPGLVACGHCTHLLRIKSGSIADRTCDGCGSVDPHDGLYPTTVTVGPLIYSLGVCQTCRWWDETSIRAA